MKKVCIVLIVIGFSCKGQTSRELKLQGEWQEYKTESLEPALVTVPYAKEYDGPKYHLRFLATGIAEDLTHFPVVESYKYKIIGDDLFIGDLKFGIELISENELVLLIHKGVLDDNTNENPYSDRFYMKRKK